VQGTELGFSHIFLVGAVRAAFLDWIDDVRSEKLLALALNECQQAPWKYGLAYGLSSGRVDGKNQRG